MKVLYCAPVRSTHYGYALELFRAGMLQAFVSGFSRFAPHGALPEIGDKLFRADLLQNVYLAALKARLPKAATDDLAYLSKIFIDQTGKYINFAADGINHSGFDSANELCRANIGRRINKMMYITRPEVQDFYMVRVWMKL